MKSIVPVLALLLVGCSHVKEFAPIRISPIYPRLPNQQRLVAQSATQAVEQACKAIDLKQYAGKTTRVEVNGVFPHSHEDLLDYIASGVELYASWADMVVLPRRDPRFQNDQIVVGDGRGSAQANDVRDVDVRLIASVDWGGVDLRDQKYVKGGKLAGQVIVSILTLGLGVIWPIASPPEGHIFTMIGRVRVTLRVIPVSKGLRPALASGAGESSVVIDPDSDAGYSLIMDLPMEGSETYQRRAQ